MLARNFVVILLHHVPTWYLVSYAILCTRKKAKVVPTVLVASLKTTGFFFFVVVVVYSIPQMGTLQTSDIACM